MDSAKFLITGADGQLGKALQAQYPDAHAVDSQELDITDQAAVASFDWSGITTIMNAAAYTNVDGAETDEGRVTAWKVNADSVANLVAVAAQKDAVLVHISTDYVFDGTRNVHKEDEPFSPLSAYAASKAAGDIVASLAPKHYILRTSWVIGDGHNFVRTMMGLAKKNVSPTVVADQVGRVTFASELAGAIDHLLMSKAEGGTYNVTNDGEPASWAEIARAIFAELHRHDLTVTDTTTAEYFANKPLSARRPLQSTLDLSKMKATGWQPGDWREELKLYIKKELEK